MSIKYAILAILSAQPQTGYDLKRAFSGSSALYWAGSNNQIYYTLSDLLKAGLVSKEVQPQEKRPARSVYTPTERGLEELKNWAVSRPEAPEYRSSFWIRLMAAGQLTASELKLLLDQYEHEVHAQLLMQREKVRRVPTVATRAGREDMVQRLIEEGIAGFYERELEWVRSLRQRLEME